MSRDALVIVHIVDDDDSMRVALVRLFSAAGYAARGYASAGDFLVAAAEAPTGCLVLDMHMPGPDGLALQDALRRRGQSLPASLDLVPNRGRGGAIFTSKLVPARHLGRQEELESAFELGLRLSPVGRLFRSGCDLG